MSARMSEARKAAFLRALAATGNVTVAAERTNVSRSWVRLQRRSDAAFEAACKAALAAARASLDKLGAGGSNTPPAGWGHLDGVELVVRGSNGRRVQIARARAHQWSARVEERFLRALSSTCNVKASYKEVGMGKSSTYQHRRRWPAFAKRCDEAIATGYMRLEDALVANACNLFSEPELPPECAMPPMTVAEAIHLMHMHKHRVHGLGKAPGQRWRPPPALDDVRESIERKFAAFERASGLGEAEKARDRRLWALRRRPGKKRRGR